MGLQDEDGTDVSSIKPVSSLRSRFESLQTPTKPRSRTPAPIKQTSFPSQIDTDRPRTSLDLPRRSPWNHPPEPPSTSDFTKSMTLSPTDNLQKRHFDPGRAQQPRPVSMSIWEGESRPPAVTLQSPVSPPRPILSNQAQSISLNSPNHSLFTSRPRGSNGSPAILLPRAVTPPNVVKPPLEVEAVRKVAAHPSLGNTKLPPPVNRAKKPATPTAASFTTTTLQPRKSSVDAEASPFTTPPSSDESPGKHTLSVPPAIPVATKPSQSKTISKQTSYFPPPPTHHSVEAQRRRSDSANSRSSGYPRIRTGSVDTVKSHEYSDHPDSRPNLPARRNLSPTRSDSKLVPNPSRVGKEIQKSRTPSPAPPRPSEASKGGFRKSMDIRRPNIQEFLPPPKRSVAGNEEIAAPSPTRMMRHLAPRIIDNQIHVPAGHSETSFTRLHETSTGELQPLADYPDATQSNRRPPRSKYGVPHVYPNYDTRSIEICGEYVVTLGYHVQAWDLKNGRLVLDLGHEEGGIKVTALAFKPGASAEQDGQFIWTGNKNGELQEIDIKHRNIVYTKPGAHNYREIVQLHRYQNLMVSIDEDGKLHIWPPGDNGIPSLGIAPTSFRVSRGHTFSIMVQNHLWFAAGKQIHIYNLLSEDDFHVTPQSLGQSNAGDIITGAVISNQLDRVYFGHTDGKVTVYSALNQSCIGVVNVSSYRIATLASAGHYLWAGFSNGMIHVYDTRPSPWLVKKEWLAHQGPVARLVSDKSSFWKTGNSQIASIGLENTIKLWDGFLEEDWLEADMRERDVEYCQFQEVKTVVVTWNAGASTPGSLRYDQKDANFFRETIQTENPPDIIVFGFQELVDLEDKKLTAKSLFKGSKKKESSEHEHMGRQYRAWRDFLVRLLEEEMPQVEDYQLLHTANMVGLFSCIFIKTSLRDRIHGVTCGEIKRGLGGLHGNKGALIMRFFLGDTSLCFINCHLAAGQSQTVNRNEDATAILESTVLDREKDLDVRNDLFIGGGDGSMIMDHEICILNGDLNYRIDTMSRETVIKAIKAEQLSKLLERDQLLVSKRRNPAFKLRAFNEQPINFAPTYKYDVGTDRYDTSEKSRSPAWCDRVLYRGVGRIKPMEYRRHEVRTSDHRPVSATFKMRIKKIIPDRRKLVWTACEGRLEEARKKLGNDAKMDYLISVLGVSQAEAMKLIK